MVGGRTPLKNTAMEIKDGTIEHVETNFNHSFISDRGNIFISSPHYLEP